MEGNDDHILKRLLDSIPVDEDVSLRRLTYISGLNYRTIAKYLELIVAIQEAHKVVITPKGMRLVVKKDRRSKTPLAAAR